MTKIELRSQHLFTSLIFSVVWLAFSFFLISRWNISSIPQRTGLLFLIGILPALTWCGINLRNKITLVSEEKMVYIQTFFKMHKIPVKEIVLLKFSGFEPSKKIEMRRSIRAFYADYMPNM